MYRGEFESKRNEETIGGMKPLSVNEVSQSFSRNDRRKLWIPDLSQIAWKEIDYLSWQHRDGSVWHVVYNLMGELHGIKLDRLDPTNYQNRQCSWCATVNSGSKVAQFATRHRRDKERLIGNYICSNLDCNDYIRGKKFPSAPGFASYPTVEKRIKALRQNLDEFFFQILF